MWLCLGRTSAADASGHIEQFKLEPSGVWLGGKVTAVNDVEVDGNAAVWAALAAALPEQPAVASNPASALKLRLEVPAGVALKARYDKQTQELPSRGWTRVLQRRSAELDGVMYGASEPLMLTPWYRLPALLRWVACCCFAKPLPNLRPPRKHKCCAHPIVITPPTDRKSVA